MRSIALCAAALAVCPEIACAQSISELDGLAPASSCQAMAVSADGSVVAGYANFPGGVHAFRWTPAGGVQDLGDFGYGSVAYAISADGACVVGWAGVLIQRPDGSLGGYARVTRWTAQQGLENIGGGPSVDPSSGISNSGIGRAVNADGSVIVGDGGGPCLYNEAFRWTRPTGTQSLGTFAGGDLCYSDVTVAGISADGSVAVGQADRKACRWVGGAGAADLGNLTDHPARYAAATGVSADGSVIVGVWGVNIAGGEFQAFRWRQGLGMENLGSLGGNVASAVRVSADGLAVVGTSETAGGQNRPFLWTAELGMVDLQSYLPTIGVDLTGWSLCNATGVSADGRTIIGNACVSPGATSGFILRLPTAPPACPADFNGDGFLDFFDADAFLGCFQGQECVPGRDADFDHDGFVDFFDADAYFAAFEAGC